MFEDDTSIVWQSKNSLPVNKDINVDIKTIKDLCDAYFLAFNIEKAV